MLLNILNILEKRGYYIFADSNTKLDACADIKSQKVYI
jgi:hypothetical protein